MNRKLMREFAIQKRAMDFKAAKSGCKMSLLRPIKTRLCSYTKRNEFSSAVFWDMPPIDNYCGEFYEYFFNSATPRKLKPNSRLNPEIKRRRVKRINSRRAPWNDSSYWAGYDLSNFKSNFFLFAAILNK